MNQKLLMFFTKKFETEREKDKLITKISLILIRHIVSTLVFCGGCWLWLIKVNQGKRLDTCQDWFALFNVLLFGMFLWGGIDCFGISGYNSKISLLQSKTETLNKEIIKEIEKI